MFPLSRPGWLASAIGDRKAAGTASLVVESYPPSALSPQRSWTSRVGRWLGAQAWVDSGPAATFSFGQRHRNEALAAARLDFADSLYDVRTPAAAGILDRIAVTRSLHELWHFRNEIFGHVARRHGQTEAATRVAALDTHFPRRLRRAGFAARA